MNKIKLNQLRAKVEANPEEYGQERIVAECFALVTEDFSNQVEEVHKHYNDLIEKYRELWVKSVAKMMGKKDSKIMELEASELKLKARIKELESE